MLRFGYDDTNGIVIGEIDTKKHYTFHAMNGEVFASGDFENDNEAEQYVKGCWMSYYKNKVEMRCYERS